MSTTSNNVRKGVTNASFNEKNSRFLYVELFIISIGCGIYFHSWLVFGIVLLGLVFSLFLRKLAIAIIVLLSIGWAFIGYFVGALFDNIAASMVLALLALLISIGLHYSALQWATDID